MVEQSVCGDLEVPLRLFIILKDKVGSDQNAVEPDPVAVKGHDVAEAFLGVLYGELVEIVFKGYLGHVGL